MNISPIGAGTLSAAMKRFDRAVGSVVSDTTSNLQPGGADPTLGLLELRESEFQVRVNLKALQRTWQVKGDLLDVLA